MWKIFTTVVLICLVTIPFNVSLAGMSSTNYKIISDAIDAGGITTSSNYSFFGSVTESEGVSASANYKSLAGFPSAQPDSSLSISVSNSTLSFGTFERGIVSSKSTAITVSTDAPGGYSLRISENKNFTSGTDDINDVSDGQVSDGGEEYGIRTSGTAGLYNSSDTPITSNWKSIASSSGTVSSQQTTVIFKAVVDTGTTPGTYSHTVTFAAVANY